MPPQASDDNNNTSGSTSGSNGNNFKADYSHISHVLAASQQPSLPKALPNPAQKKPGTSKKTKTKTKKSDDTNTIQVISIFNFDDAVSDETNDVIEFPNTTIVTETVGAGSSGSRSTTTMEQGLVSVVCIELEVCI